MVGPVVAWVERKRNPGATVPHSYGGRGSRGVYHRAGLMAGSGRTRWPNPGYTCSIRATADDQVTVRSPRTFRLFRCCGAHETIPRARETISIALRR